jgi:SAM-dependent methyltransferase
VKTDEDAFGRELMDYMSGVNRCEVIERDDGYLDVNDDIGVYFEPYEKWPAHHRAAMAHARGRVLDIGCGAGRHAIYLQRVGLRVTGIDVSPLAVRVCRMRGLTDARVLSITRLSRSLGRFDTVMMLANNFGLFGSPRRAKWALKRLRNVTSDDATILAESTDPYADAPPVHRRYHRLNRERGRMAGQLRVRLRYRQYQTRWFDYLLVSKREMEGIVAGTGWHVDEFIGSNRSIYIGVLRKDGGEAP